MVVVVVVVEEEEEEEESRYGHEWALLLVHAHERTCGSARPPTGIQAATMPPSW